MVRYYECPVCGREETVRSPMIVPFVTCKDCLKKTHVLVAMTQVQMFTSTLKTARQGASAWASNAFPGFQQRQGTKPMTPTTNVRIWWDTSVAAYRMTSSFNKDLVDGIKSFIPISDRSYDAATKVWTFVERQLTPLQQLLKTLNCSVTVMTRQQVEQQQAQSQTPNAMRGKPLDTVIVEFVKLVPYDAMLKAYRGAAIQLHPDKGGSADKMSTLNSAWSRLQKEVYGQQ